MNLATYTMYNMHEEDSIGDVVTEQLKLNTNHNCVPCVPPSHLPVLQQGNVQLFNTTNF
jgi:hypothetical protein